MGKHHGHYLIVAGKVGLVVSAKELKVLKRHSALHSQPKLHSPSRLGHLVALTTLFGFIAFVGLNMIVATDVFCTLLVGGREVALWSKWKVFFFHF
jgi:hypothetical protein